MELGPHRPPRVLRILEFLVKVRHLVEELDLRSRGARHLALLEGGAEDAMVLPVCRQEQLDLQLLGRQFEHLRGIADAARLPEITAAPGSEQSALAGATVSAAHDHEPARYREPRANLLGESFLPAVRWPGRERRERSARRRRVGQRPIHLLPVQENLGPKLRPHPPREVHLVHVLVSRSERFLPGLRREVQELARVLQARIQSASRRLGGRFGCGGLHGSEGCLAHFLRPLHQLERRPVRRVPGSFEGQKAEVEALSSQAEHLVPGVLEGDVQAQVSRRDLAPQQSSHRGSICGGGALPADPVQGWRKSDAPSGRRSPQRKTRSETNCHETTRAK